MRRLLVITYYWPPAGGSGVQRWVKFCKYLPQYGWQPVVFTPSNPDIQSWDGSLLGDIPSGTEVIRRPIREPYALYRRLVPQRDAAQVNPLSASNSSLAGRVFRALRGNLFIPDPRVSWVRPSVRFLKKYLAGHPVDAVVTTGPPHSMHLIGLGLKRATGVRWIADFRDPWTQMFYYKHLGLTEYADRRHHRLEKAVLDGADAVIAVSPPVRDDFAAMTSTPVELITNGFDEDDFLPAGQAALLRDDDCFNIVHTGLLAADGNPLCLWNVLSAMCREDSRFASKLRIKLAGKTDPQVIDSVRERGLGGNLVDLGYLPHSRTVEEQCRADLLILPLRREPEYAKVLPGKIFEYMASRRPVLGIGQSDGAAARILEESGSGKMFDWDDEQGVSSFIRAPHGVGGDIDAYSRRRLTEKLIRLL